MADPVFVRLSHRAVLEVAGDDRVSFLQGLVSNDVTRAAADRAIWAALLTPQGKFLFDMFVVAEGERLLLEVEAARAEELRKKLSLYKLRAKVAIALVPSLSVFAALDANAALGLADEAGAAAGFGGGIAFVDPRLALAGARLLLPDAAPLTAAGLAEAPLALWDGHRIRAGLPDGSRDLPVDKAILLENGFDELGGVDFKKGCYMGQELTSRTKYRGLVRKRLMPVRIDGPAPAPGTPVLLGEVEAGEMRSSQGGDGLALLRLERLKDADGAAFVCGDARLTPVKPAWAVFPEVE